MREVAVNSMRYHARRLVGLVLLAIALPAQAARLGDIADLQGERKNELFGIGLVIGLDGTGDSSSSGLTQQLIQSAVDKNDIRVDTRAIKPKNVAVVAVTADLPENADDGVEFPITVSSLMDAKSLRGGQLLPTSLTAANDEVYALASGAVTVGGVSASSRGSSVQMGHTTAGVVPDGGRVVRTAAVDLNRFVAFQVIMHRNEVVTATNAANTINGELLGDFAHAVNGRKIVVTIPEQFLGRVPELYARLKPLPIDIYRDAKVVVDERTGTVIVGADVKIATVAIAHGGLMVSVDTDVDVSQAAPFGDETVRFEESVIDVQQEYREMQVLEGVDISELVSALNALGVSPQDLVIIFRALDEADALDAELEIVG